MSDRTEVKTTKTVYPQIYAYVLPEYKPNEGWIKIGYTEKKNVEERIKEQTQTAGIGYAKLWSGPAQFLKTGEWFKDTQLHDYLVRFKKIEKREGIEWFYYDGYPEQAEAHFKEFRQGELSQAAKELQYQLRAEQEDAVRMTLDYAKNHQGGEFLWNAKPRFGKTLSAYDLARRMKAEKVLIVTNRPAIANSWFDDFERFIAWQTNYIFVSTSDSLKDRPVLTREQFLKAASDKVDDEFPGCMAFVSLQDLKGAISFGGLYNKLKWIKDLNWDLLIIDEAHEGVDTFKTDIAFDEITRNFTLHLSGTPFKAVAMGKFAQDQIYNWTYADEQEAKSNWPVESEENNPYEALPSLNLFSYQMSRMITDEVNKGARIDGKDMDFAFDLNEFFATDDNGKFTHEAEVKKWLDTLTNNEKYPFSTKELRAELKHTFWVLNRVASAKALEKLLRDHPVFENYEVILAAGDGRTDDDEGVVNQKSLDRVRAAIKKKDRTITLSVGQLTTGVTVREWTAVFMLSNIKSPSLYMQAAFRAQNQWSYDENGQRKQKLNAYVFDFAPERTLIIYDEFANNLHSRTAAGGGTTEDRENNIKKLLNFFPVLAEDDQGRMTELDVKQVLTIPKTIKAQEVVRRGFMSNLLFQNISGVFASAEAREILEQLNPVAPGRVTPGQSSSHIDIQGVRTDDEGNALVDNAIVINTTEARFGEKVYGNLDIAVADEVEKSATGIAKNMASAFTESVLDTVKTFAKEKNVTQAFAEQVVRENANIIAREVEVIQEKAKIKEKEARVVYETEVAAAQSDNEAVAHAKARYETLKQEIAENQKEEISQKVTEKARELSQKTTEAILQKAEDGKKNYVEDDIRSRLRGFARTIPSFLMAYGEASTTLANIDINIKDEVFKEVTGISLEQFRALRDKYNFFDPVVFDESIQEFLRKKAELANYFDDSQAEDIFDYIPPQQTNQIFTPKKIVKLMIDKLEEENPGLFKSKERTFADLYVKSGLYLTEIVKRLFAGLEKAIPKKEDRLKHILEKQVYGFAPSEIIYAIAKNFIYGSFANINDSNLVCRDLTETAKSGGDAGMKFDVVVGNPPYQEETESDSTRTLPIYNFFMELAYKISDRSCLISPARFLFNAGYTPKSWNQKMLDDEHLKVEFYELDSSKVFPNTDIKGGIAVTYRDSNAKFGAIKTFTTFPELNSILKKVSQNMTDSLSSIIYGQLIYQYTSKLSEDYPSIPNVIMQNGKYLFRTSAFDKFGSVFFDTKPEDGNEYIKILGLQSGKRVYKWVKIDYIAVHPSFYKYKVFVPAANGSGALGEVLSTPLIGTPLIGTTQTFLTIGSFDKKIEAQNCLKYIKSKFARTMLGILKITQDNPGGKWIHVPLQDFTPQSDIDWTQSISNIDQQLYKKYGLSKKEIAFIEEKVRAME